MYINFDLTPIVKMIFAEFASLNIRSNIGLFTVIFVNRVNNSWNTFPRIKQDNILFRY